MPSGFPNLFFSVDVISFKKNALSCHFFFSPLPFPFLFPSSLPLPPSLSAVISKALSQEGEDLVYTQSLENDLISLNHFHPQNQKNDSAYLL
jgi:hypothetical protein